MNYTDGSPCPDTPVSSLLGRGIIGDDDDDDDDNKDDKNHKNKDKDEDDKKGRKGGSKEPSTHLTRRKNTIISLLCNTDPLAPLNTVSFVASPDSSPTSSKPALRLPAVESKSPNSSSVPAVYLASSP